MAKKHSRAHERLMNFSVEPASEVPQQKALMVCVTGQRSCERLIERGVSIRMPEQPFYVVHCVQTGRVFMNFVSDPEAIEYLFTCAGIANAELAILREDDVVDALVDFAQTHNVSTIVLGASPNKNAVSFSARLSARLNDVDFIIVE